MHHATIKAQPTGNSKTVTSHNSIGGSPETYINNGFIQPDIVKSIRPNYNKGYIDGYKRMWIMKQKMEDYVGSVYGTLRNHIWIDQICRIYYCLEK